MKQYRLAMFLLIAVMAGHAQTKVGTISAASASCTATSCVLLNLYNGLYTNSPSAGSATITVSANASSNTLQFEESGDGGTTWVAAKSLDSTPVSSTTSTGVWQFNMAAYTQLRVRCSTLVSGTATVTIQAAVASARSGAGGGTVTSVSGTANQIDVATGTTTAVISLDPVAKITETVFRAGADNGPALVNLQLRSQAALKSIERTSTLDTVFWDCDAGASTFVLGYRHATAGVSAFTALTPTLTPAVVAGIPDTIACASNGGTARTYQGVSLTCSSLSATAITANDTFETNATPTADGTSKRCTSMAMYQ